MNWSNMKQIIDLFLVLVLLQSCISEVHGSRRSRKACSSCKTVVDILESMKSLITVLNEEVCSLKLKVNQNCSSSNQQDYQDYSCLIDSLEKNIKDSMSSTTPSYGWSSTPATTDYFDNIGSSVAAGHTPEAITLTTTPHSPTRCPREFKLIGGGCFQIFANPSEWASFGDANEMCKSKNASLATPTNPSKLREYLKNGKFAKKFWIGANRVKRRSWKWLDDKEMTKDDWDVNNPSRNGSKRCVYWRHPNYLSVNHYCGEKFSFICEHKGL